MEIDREQSAAPADECAGAIKTDQPTLLSDGPPARGRVLLVEPDVALTRFLSRGLGTEFAVTVVHDAEAALETVAASPYELVVMDLNQPRVDGMTLLEQLRRSFPRLPLMVLTARSRALVAALEAGADDFVVKPFSFVELVARMRALLRRTSGAAAPMRSSSEALTLNRAEYKVDRAGRRIELTPREFAILETLIRNAGKPVSRATLMDEVWKTPMNPASNIVDVYMKYLRDKIDGHGEEKLIRTIRGVGYVLGRADIAPVCGHGRDSEPIAALAC